MYRFNQHRIKLITILSCLTFAPFALAHSHPTAAKTEQNQNISLKDQVIGTVDGMPITQKDVRVALNENGSDEFTHLNPRQKKFIFDYVANIKTFDKIARSRHVESYPYYAEMLAFSKMRLNFTLYVLHETQAAATPDKIEEFYNKKFKALQPKREMRARHILVNTEAEAIALKKRLDQGEKFDDLLKELKNKEGDNFKSGELSWFTEEQMDPAFSKAAFALKTNEVSAPVHSAFGWHIIQSLESRLQPVPKLEDVKDQIKSYLTSEAQKKLIMDVATNQKIIYKDPELKKYVEELEAQKAQATQTETSK